MNYKIADVVFNIKTRYEVCQKFMIAYKTDEQEKEFIYVSDEDLNLEKINEPNFSEAYLESLCVFRNICKVLLKKYNGMIFHCSAIKYKGKAILFAAKSGTGKSTHSALWKKIFNKDVEYINDDKPLIRYVDGKFYVYGSPWMGKHNLGTNSKCEIFAICKLERGETPSTTLLDKIDAVNVILNQTLIESDELMASNLLELINLMVEKVKFYKDVCTLDEESALIAKKTILGDE